jgi:hypothetical protein
MYKVDYLAGAYYRDEEEDILELNEEEELGI